MTPTPHMLIEAVLTLVVALVMVRLSLRRNAQAVRASGRRCASCRRRIETPYCPHCTR
ncbi:MAG TPA: hypothetical protein VLD16_11520 [Gaiellaceae bacterium]|nr:hypothetical protein [Gaiellaceae bacterium]